MHGTQRRTQLYATMLVAARHRPQRRPMTDSDYSWASKQIGTSKATRKTVKRDLGLALQSVSLDSAVPDLKQETPWLKDDELQEADPTAEEADEAAADNDRGGMAGCAQDSKVKVADIRRVLSNDTVIEVLWAYTPEGEPEVYLALITEIKQRIVRARWLHEIDQCDDVFIIDPNYPTVSIEIKLIWDTCADVTEPSDAAPDGVPSGVRWWRRAIERAVDLSEPKAESSAASTTGQPAESTAKVATEPQSSSTKKDRPPKGEAPKEVLQEPVLFGSARRLRAEDSAYSEVSISFES
jgi:hypothetical protein